MPRAAWGRVGRSPGRIVLILVAPVLLAACGGSGGASVAPSDTSSATPAVPASASGAPSATGAPPSAPATSSIQPTETTMTFNLTSSAFNEGGRIPRKFSCDGENVSPALSWNGAPDGTTSFALIVDDPDANGFIHWIVFNMTGSQTGSLPEAVSAGTDAPPQGVNGFGKIGWGGPCPPSGTHRYRFTLYALDAMLDIANAPRIDALRHAMNGHVLDQAVLQASYTRGG